MDAAEEERDVQLQRASADLLSDFKTSLHPFLWINTEKGKQRIRRRVRVQEAERLIALLEPFQELPQLLDPHLESFVPTLGDALLEFLRENGILKSRPLLWPLSKAICKLLYTLCKIRGEKVIVRFLSPETKNLELVLSAFEVAETHLVAVDMDEMKKPLGWEWEERYVTLLWLSHLLLAPFDLATISSVGTGDIGTIDIPGLLLPPTLPGVTLRLIPLAIKYLATAGKERDSAKALLVRLCMRRDMQELGLLNSLVQWALSNLRPANDVAGLSIYHYIGILSFLGGILVSSSNTADMNKYLLQIFHIAQGIVDQENVAFETVRSSALARKTVIKVIRTISTIILRGNTSDQGSEVVESTIGYLLEALADNDTPVRLAASKALSIITLKLQAEMASQVVDAVLDSLKVNVLWQNQGPGKASIRDLTAVNPQEWHGLTLTLSHLLYRRSPPPDSLSDILDALLVGLSFERRSAMGTSIGTNVRDAACFGIWALARRYTTKELQNVSTASMNSAKHHDESLSVLQVLATELVVAASLDSAGNIRRGASAALQELIGRHPDTIIEGIAVVQTVDYHAVALRSRAITEIALEAARLSETYWNALFDALLGWRGLGDPDASARRVAAKGIGGLSHQLFMQPSTPWTRLQAMTERIQERLAVLKLRQVEERHGLILSLAALIPSHESLTLEQSATSEAFDAMKSYFAMIFRVTSQISQDAVEKAYRRPELIAESICQLISKTYKLLGKLPTEFLMNDGSLNKLAKTHIEIGLRRTEKEVIDAASGAAKYLVSYLQPKKRPNIAEIWEKAVLDIQSGRSGQFVGFLFALAASFQDFPEETKKEICKTFKKRWTSSSDIESKIAVLQALTQGCILETHTSEFVHVISEGLDNYTTDARGDIGSLVRIEAVRAARKIMGLVPWSRFEQSENAWYADSEIFGTMYGRVLRLAGEKLDNVRNEAQLTVAETCKTASVEDAFKLLSSSSIQYFEWLLDLQINDWLVFPHHRNHKKNWSLHLLEGYVLSADSGSEELIRSSRAALVAFCEREAISNSTSVDQNITPIDFVCGTLFEVAKKNATNDRVLVPALEVMSFLYDVGIMQQSSIQWRSLYLLVQKAHYKTGNIRKLEAAVKLYGGLIEVYPEALQKLTTMLLHPFPKIRNEVADTLFAVKGLGKGVDWVKASKADLQRLKVELAEIGE